jgi:hypothetical protein
VEYRIYFNRKNLAPQIWSCDEGDTATEVNVIDFKLHRCDADSHYDPAISDRDPDHPTAWFTVPHAIMLLRHGVAHFFRDPAFQYPSLTEREIDQQARTRIDEIP